MGLNDSYQQARRQTMLMNPLPMPNLNQAYAIVMEDKTQKVLMESTGSIGMNIVSTNGLECLSLYS